MDAGPDGKLVGVQPAFARAEPGPAAQSGERDCAELSDQRADANRRHARRRPLGRSVARPQRQYPQPAALASAYQAVYDAWNRLVRVGTDATPSLAVAEFQYDGMGRNTIKKSYSPAGTLSETRHLFYSRDWQVVEERVGTNPNTAPSDKQYVWGQRYIDDCVLRIGPDLGNSSEKIHALQDANWNVTALVDFATGNVLERYEYDPYGQRAIMDAAFASRASSNYGWIVGLAGYRSDDVVELYSVRHRFLHPALGRFATRDSVGYVAGLNLYSYVWGNPITLRDPLGNAPFTVCCTFDRCCGNLFNIFSGDCTWESSTDNQYTCDTKEFGGAQDVRACCLKHKPWSLKPGCSAYRFNPSSYVGKCGQRSVAGSAARGALIGWLEIGRAFTYIFRWFGADFSKQDEVLEGMWDREFGPGSGVKSATRAAATTAAVSGYAAFAVTAWRWIVPFLPGGGRGIEWGCYCDAKVQRMAGDWCFLVEQSTQPPCWGRYRCVEGGFITVACWPMPKNLLPGRGRDVLPRTRK